MLGFVGIYDNCLRESLLLALRFMQLLKLLLLPSPNHLGHPGVGSLKLSRPQPANHENDIAFILVIQFQVSSVGTFDAFKAQRKY